RCVDDVLDADRDAVQRPRACGADVFGMADKSANSFVRADRLKRPADRRIGRKIVGIDAALEFGERDHWRVSLQRPNSFYVPRRDRASASPSLRGDAKHRSPNLEISDPREDACPGTTGVNPLPHSLRLLHTARRGTVWTSKPRAQHT